MSPRIETRLRGLRRAFGRTALTRRLFAHVHRGAADCGAAGQDAATGAHRRGLVVVQIDGLSHRELERALAAGEMPLLARLRAREAYRLHRLYSGLPSSTPAVQGELFYGVPGAVPAFAWRERESGELRRMYDPGSAKRVEHGLRARGAPLLAGGSAYCDIYTGGAAEAHFCVASLGWSDVLQRARPHAWAGVALMHLPTLVRAAALTALEGLLAIGDAVRGIARGHRAWPELKFVAARMAVVVVLRDLVTIGAKVDIARGLPIVHLNFLGYDEQAHRRGPDTAFARRALRGIDRRIAALWRATHLAEHRHYDLWVYGDHGQTHAVPYARHTGRSIEASVEAALLACRDERPAARVDVVPAPVTSVGEAPSRAHLLGGRHLPRLFPEASPAAAADGARATVVGMGPVAHVLLGPEARRDAATLGRLADWLVGPGAVPAVLFVADHGAVRARTREALLELPAAAGRLLGSDHPALPDVVTDLLALVGHPDAGDLVLLGWANGCRSLSFAEENGAHAGAAPAETLSFALLPGDALGIRGRAAPLRPLDLRQAALHTLGRQDTAGVAAPARTEAVPAGRASTSRPAPAPRPRERRLRVMSYNVHGCVGTDGRLAPERVARVIARQAPDVVALQELDVRRSRSGRRDQAAAIAALLEMDHRFHPAIRVEEEAYGNAILTRLPVLAHREGLLPALRGRLGTEPRGVLWITLELGGSAVQVIDTHFGLRPAERRVQVAELLSERWLAHLDCSGPTILCGDLNATRRSAPLRRLRETFVDAREATAGGGRRSSFPARYPMFAIDHVLTRDVQVVERAIVPRSELARLASDHLPLVVDLRLGTAPGAGAARVATRTGAAVEPA